MFELLNFSNPNIKTGLERKGRLLNILLLGISGVDIFAIGMICIQISLGVDEVDRLFPILWSGLIFLACAFFIFWVNRIGRVLVASTLFIIVTVFCLTFASGDTLSYGATQFYFVIPILISSVIITPFSSFYVAAANSIIFFISKNMVGFDSRFDFGVLGMFAIAFVSWISARALENALENLHTSNHLC
jgi:hypothetical protein